MYFLVALTAVTIYELNRKELRKLGKKLGRKYDDWVDS